MLSYIGDMIRGRNTGVNSDELNNGLSVATWYNSNLRDQSQKE